MKFDIILIEPQYFPPLEYFAALSVSKEVKFELYEYFEKQTYRNRCRILTASGILLLSVPLHRSSKIISRDITIDYSQKWVEKHKMAIQSSYGKSPFFYHYRDLFFEKLDKKYTFLIDLNIDLLSICLDLLGIDIKTSKTEKYEKSPGGGITDLRSVIHPKKDSSLTLQEGYKPYLHVFGKKFVPNLSVLDLLFCEGPNSGYVIRGKGD